MNADQIAEALEEDIRKAYGDKLVSDATILAGVPEMCEEIGKTLQEALSDWEVGVVATEATLLLQKNLVNPFTESAALHGIEISTTGTVRIWQKQTFRNLYGNEIQQYMMMGTSSKDVSRMLQEFRPPVPNPEYELKDDMQGILALTVCLEKPIGDDHFEQLKVIKDWCTPNNFCVTSLMQYNFWSEVHHDAEKFVEHVIGMVDREGNKCTGVVVSKVEILDEILLDFCTKAIARLRDRGKHLYAADAGEVTMAPHKEFGMLLEAEAQAAKQSQLDTEPDLNSILEQTRVGFDQLEYIEPGSHQYSINFNGQSIQVLDVKKLNGHYSVTAHFFGAEGKPWSRWQAVCTWEFVISHSKDEFAKYEGKWKERYGK